MQDCQQKNHHEADLPISDPEFVKSLSIFTDGISNSSKATGNFGRTIALTVSILPSSIFRPNEFKALEENLVNILYQLYFLMMSPQFYTFNIKVGLVIKEQ